jgi:excisionase family DNA binding protein
MRSQGEAEIAIEQGETRYEGVTWTTRRQLASNQSIPLPEPARRGLINLADDVLATTNQAVAAGAPLDPAMSPDQPDPLGRGVSGLRPSRIRSPTRTITPQEDHADELHFTRREAIVSTTGSEPRLLLRIEEAVEQLGIGRSFMYELVLSGTVESVRLGRLRRIPEECLREHVDRLRSEARRDTVE